MKHSTLGASSSARWLSCPASVKMVEGLKDKGSFFAAEGTAAHDLAEQALNADKPASEFIGNEISGFIVNDEMANNVQRYVDYIADIQEGSVNPTLLVEQRVSYEEWVPQGFGTSDAIVIDGETVHVIDLKYGKGEAVYADNNTQAMLYALGVLQGFNHIHDFKTFVLHIVQPRIGNYSEWSISCEDLLAFGEYASERAELCGTKDAPFGPSEKACRWCKASGNCKALAEHNLKIIGAEFDDLENITIPDTNKLTADQVAKLLPNVTLITGWLKAVESYALDAICSGGEIPGYKAVNGRSNRRWADNSEDIVVNMLGEQAYTRKLITPTQAEKILKKEFSELSDVVVKPEGKATLVPVTDKRPPISTILDEFKEV